MRVMARSIPTKLRSAPQPGRCSLATRWKMCCIATIILLRRCATDACLA